MYLLKKIDWMRSLFLCLGFALAAPVPASARQTSPGCPPDAFEPNDSCAAAATLSPGLHVGLTTATGDPDVYRIVVGAGQRLDVTFTAQTPSLLGTIELRFDDGSVPPCQGVSAGLPAPPLSGSTTPVVLTWTTPPSAGGAFFVKVDPFGPCTTYRLNVVVSPDPCAAVAPDALENNDDCANATPIGVGSYPNLNVSRHDPDVVQLLAAPGELLTVRVDLTTPGAAVLLTAREGTLPCSSAAVVGDPYLVPGGSSGAVYVFNDSTVPRSYLVEIRLLTSVEIEAWIGLPSLGTEFCGDYSLHVSSVTNPCNILQGDPFEPNSSCATAPLLTSSQSGLTIRAGGDLDYYSVVVPPRSSMRLKSTSSTPGEARKMRMYSACSGFGSQTWTGSGPLDSVPGDTRHYLNKVNMSSSPLQVYVLVQPPVAWPSPYCDVYDLDLSFTPGYVSCLASRNASGNAAFLSASGSTVVGQGTLTLVADSVPTVTTGLMIFSSTSSGSPFPFGFGYRCLFGSILRTPITSTSTGVLQTTIDWSGPASAITPGSTWGFQAWFRDTSGGVAGFNTSDALILQFQ